MTTFEEKKTDSSYFIWRYVNYKQAVQWPDREIFKATGIPDKDEMRLSFAADSTVL